MMLLEIAKYWKNNGTPVIPLYYQSKRPMVKWENYEHTLPTDLELLQWFPTDFRNIGLIVGGSLLFLVVIDFDIMDVFDYWYSMFPITTYMVKTRRGVHVYVNTVEPAKNYHTGLLDVKAERGYVLIPPSIHPSGFQYQVYKDAPILTVEKLEDILPKAFTPEPELTVQTIIPMRRTNNDPWSVADNALEIPNNAVQKIRQNVSILSFFPDAKSTSTDKRWWVTKCPFHDDHNPSFWIDTQRQICGCRKCNIKEMDAINLYARLNNISNQDAILELLKRL